MVPALEDRKLYPGVLLRGPYELGLGGQCPAVLEENALLELFELLFRRDALYLDEIGLGHLECRVNKLVREVAVVCKKEHPFGVIVKPAYGVDPGAYPGYELRDDRPVVLV